MGPFGDSSGDGDGSGGGDGRIYLVMINVCFDFSRRRAIGNEGEWLHATDTTTPAPDEE